MINHQFEMILASVLSGLMGFIPLVLFVLGIAASRGKRQALRTFVPVEAVVVSQKMIQRNNPDYRPDIEYEYEVEGSIYRSTNLWSGLGVQSVFHFSRKKAQHLLDQYPVGQTVPAFRDPGDATQAFLVRDHPSFLHDHRLTTIGGLGALVCFGCSIGFAWKAGVLWALIGGLGLCGVLIAAWFRGQVRQAKREDKN